MLSRLKPKSEFTKNVLTLMTGTAIAQAIPIAISPILTRIYSPEDFGIFALFLSIASLVGVGVTARYELAIMLPKKKSDAMQILYLSLLITVLISLVALLVVFLFNEQITLMLGNQAISKWLYFVPISVFLTGVYQSLNYWFNRNREFKKIATSKIAQSATVGVSNLGIGALKGGSLGLILGNILGQLSAVLILAKKLIKVKSDFKTPKKIKMAGLAKYYKKLPLFNLPNAIIDGFRLSGINILIAKFFTTATLGQFSLAWKMVQAPMALVGSSLSQVFFQKVSSTPKQELYRIVIQFIQKALMIAIPLFLLIYFFAPELFALVFGQKWRVAGEAASVMTPWLLLNFITSPLSTLFIVLNKQDAVLYFSIIYMVLPLALIYFFHTLPFLVVLKIVTLAMSLMLLIFIVMVLYFTKKAAN